jgi:single-stranded DNA-specific DHH superfamily exonuclease
MISTKKLAKIKQELEDSSNPLFLFDNDPDGFCSATILIKNFQKGTAFPLKSFPDLDSNLIEKIERVSPDKIFILDKPLTDESFFNSMKDRGISIVVIDHHEMDLTKSLKDKATFFNSFPSSEPTSFICQKICNNKNTLWISLIGCVHDVFMPEFIDEFKEDYPEMIGSNLEISSLKYSSELGELTLILSLALKSSNQTIQNILELFLNSTGPKDILLENEKNSYIHKKYKQLNKIIEKNLLKAKHSDNLVFLEYSGEYSLSSDIANKLFFQNPKRFIAVCYKKYDAINISLRGSGAKEFTEEFVSTHEEATGGGHKVACGLRVSPEIFDEFKQILFTRFQKP